jgi:hypothetical protein
MELLSEVAVLHEMPEKGLVRGQVGAVVRLLAPSWLKSSSATIKGAPTPWLHCGPRS